MCSMQTTLTDLSHGQSASCAFPARPIECVGCRQPIFDRFVLRIAPELTFHAHCLKCTTCSGRLDEAGSAFVRDGKTYCRADYMRLTTCHGCHRHISPSEVVQSVLDRRYHESCFTCSHCKRPLVRGDHFAVRRDELLCRWHIHGVSSMAEECSIIEEGSTSGDEESEVENDGSLQQTSVSPPSGQFRHPLGLTSNLYPPHVGRRSSVVDLQHRRASNKAKREKGSRVRTSMSEEQLDMLKCTYDNNHKPDACEKERLCRVTGLEMKVVRVWFQNRRCKDKKMREAAYMIR